jgi:creatinine amidohydrolase
MPAAPVISARLAIFFIANCFLVLCLLGGAPAHAQNSLFIEDLTTAEVSSALKAGKTTVIIPVGGTEQSGPHMALGKHNTRVHVLSGRIAATLGDALVAPVLSYVPEGNITPPTEHMRFAGTISIPEAAFKSVLTGAAQSFRQHGFTHIVLLGDHGGYQKALKEVAAGLNRQWAGTPARAHFIAEYYSATDTAYVQALKARGLSDAQIGTHAGVADTSLLLAIAPGMVRPGKLAAAAAAGRAGGTYGDPRASSAELGQAGVDAIVSQASAAIRQATGARALPLPLR